ncbi:MAG: hypothetical protein Q6L68_08495 [Thermostichus sp. DG02_5_bins_236]
MNSCNIEIAHIYIDKNNPQLLSDEVIYHVKLSTEYAGLWIQDHELKPIDYSISVLIDDRELLDSGQDRFWSFVPFITTIARHFELDYVCFESELDALLGSMLEQLSQPEVLQEDIFGRYGGILQCSHYVGIWHLMRLGSLPLMNLVIPVSQRAQLGKCSFAAETAVSILGEEYRGAERSAHRKILSRCWDPKITHRIKHSYYPSYALASGRKFS